VDDTDGRAPGAAVPEPIAATVPGAINAGLELQQGGPGGYQAVLRNRLFLCVWAAQILSQTAQNVVNYALVVEVERLTHSSTNVGWVIVSFSLPALLLGPSAGVFVDRVSKRGVLFGTNVLRALLMSAEGAIIPMLVRRRELMTATSLFNITFTVAQVAGFVLIGPTLYKLFSVEVVIIAVVVMYLLAAAFVAFLPQLERVKSTLAQACIRAVHLGSVWRDMLEARGYLLRTAGLTTAIAYLAIATAMLMTLATLGPGFVARVLGLGPEDAGYVLAPAGLGMLLTTALLGQFAVSIDRRRLASAGLVGMAISLGALALVRPLFERFTADLAKSGPGGLLAGDHPGPDVDLGSHGRKHSRPGVRAAVHGHRDGVRAAGARHRRARRQRRHRRHAAGPRRARGTRGRCRHAAPRSGLAIGAIPACLTGGWRLDSSARRAEQAGNADEDGANRTYGAVLDQRAERQA
jgi:MFS family permease